MIGPGPCRNDRQCAKNHASRITDVYKRIVFRTVLVIQYGNFDDVSSTLFFFVKVRKYSAAMPPRLETLPTEWFGTHKFEMCPDFMCVFLKKISIVSNDVTYDRDKKVSIFALPLSTRFIRIV